MRANDPTYLFEIGAAPTLKDAAGLRLRLLEAIDQHRSIQVDLSKLEDADISLIQLLIAANREATKRGQRLALASAPDCFFLEIIKHYGLLQEGPAGSSLDEDGDLWFTHSRGERQ